MPKKYGRKGKDTPLPKLYEQSTPLIIFRNKDESIAYGNWTSDGFLLKANSLITESENFEENHPGIKAVKMELIENSLLIHNEGMGFGEYMLAEDIYFHSPSAAGEIVLGHSCNGLKDWVNQNGISLGDLLDIDSNS